MYKRQELKEILGTQVLIKNRATLNDALYKMLNTENLALYFICTLVLIIALFSFIGSLIMIILDKKDNIKTLSDLGATLKEIRMTFFVQGASMIVFGGITGIVLGAIIIALQQELGLVRIGSLPYPVKFEFLNVLIVYSTILSLGLLSSKIASSRINQKFLNQD